MVGQTFTIRAVEGGIIRGMLGEVVFRDSELSTLSPSETLFGGEPFKKGRCCSGKYLQPTWRSTAQWPMFQSSSACKFLPP